MGDVINCKKCSKIMNYQGVGSRICNDCKQEEEQIFAKIKDYLYRNSGATLSQVANELQVSVQKIKLFLKEGRLEICETEGNILLECEKCGKSIRTGRLCDDCSRDFSKGLTNARDGLKKQVNEENESKTVATTGIGFRFLNKDQKK